MSTVWNKVNFAFDHVWRDRQNARGCAGAIHRLIYVYGKDAPDFIDAIRNGAQDTRDGFVGFSALRARQMGVPEDEVKLCIAQWVVVDLGLMRGEAFQAAVAALVADQIALAQEIVAEVHRAAYAARAAGYTELAQEIIAGG